MQPSPVQSYRRYPLTRLLGNGGNVRVLRALIAYAAPLSATQIAADSGLTSRGTRIVLDSLVAQGIARVLGSSRTQLFSIESDHPLLPALQSLFQQEQAAWEAFHEGLVRGLAALKAVRSAWLYGSVARGQDEPRSDVDLAVVVETEDSAQASRVRDDLQALGDGLQADLSVVVLRPSEVAHRPADDAWWSDLMRDARVLKGMSPGQEAARCARALRSARSA